MSHNVALQDQYDVIVVGSGIGGLTVASLLAQFADKRVLVLERHFKIGGFTHAFERKGFSWDVGLHYVGKVGAGEQFRQLFDLVTQGKVKWHKMPRIFERFVYPDLCIEVPDTPEAYQQTLISHFPDEAKAIRTYFKDIQRVVQWQTRYVMRNMIPSPIGDWLALPGQSFALQTTQHYLDTHFRDERLKAVLTSQWGDYGLPPTQSAFAIHALIVDQYLTGGYYPEGGAETIAESIVPIIEAVGGACLVNQEVSQIIVENGRAIGVEVKGHGRQGSRRYMAPVVISAAGIYTTYSRLLDPALGVAPYTELERLGQPLSSVNVYLGFKASPETLGFKGENHWLYTDYDNAPFL